MFPPDNELAKLRQELDEAKAELKKFSILVENAIKEGRGGEGE